MRDVLDGLEGETEESREGEGRGSVRKRGRWATLVMGISRRGGPGMVKWAELLMNLMIVTLYLIVENK